MSVFFEVGGDDSDFLTKLGFDPNDKPAIAEKLQVLEKNKELKLDNTVVDVKKVSKIYA